MPPRTPQTSMADTTAEDDREVCLRGPFSLSPPRVCSPREKQQLAVCFDAEKQKMQRLKSALWFAVGQMVDEESMRRNLNATPQFIGALTELVWTQIGTFPLVGTTTTAIITIIIIVMSFTTVLILRRLRAYIHVAENEMCDEKRERGGERGSGIDAERG